MVGSRPDPTDEVQETSQGTQEPSQADSITKIEFVDRVLDKLGSGTRAEAREAVDAVMAVLAEALVEGRGIHILPLGRLRLIREKDADLATVRILRLATPKPVKLKASEQIDAC